MNDTERFNARQLTEAETVSAPQNQKVTIASKTKQQKNQDHFNHLENL